MKDIREHHSLSLNWIFHDYTLTISFSTTAISSYFFKCHLKNTFFLFLIMSIIAINSKQQQQQQQIKTKYKQFASFNQKRGQNNK